MPNTNITRGLNLRDGRDAMTGMSPEISLGAPEFDKLEIFLHVERPKKNKGLITSSY